MRTSLRKWVWLSLIVLACSSAAAPLRAAETLPAGTKISVITDQSVSSKDAKAGQSVHGSVAQNVSANGKVIIPRGSAVVLVVSSVQASGRLSTPAKLYLRLKTVTAGGKTYTVSTSSSGKTLGGKGKRDAGFIGGGAVAGALIGGIAGGGKGAAIGAGAGAGAGTAGAAATGKQDITYPAETRFTFTTKTAVSLN